MNKIKIAATQMTCCNDKDENIANAEQLIRKAASKGAQIILLQELFEDLYFCQEEEIQHFDKARTLENNTAVTHFSKLAKELKVVLPISFFEKENLAHFNTVAVIDADGTILGKYRKTHIPGCPGYEEKFYFSPGDTGFKVWDTQYGKIGVGICWDQWFPEAARCMALMGAEIILYPTAIGSDPSNASYDSKDHWQICMQGHAAANILPVVASNRIGREMFQTSKITFYGSSFITDNNGRIIAQADRTTQGVIVAEIDLDAFKIERETWGVFRDRRPEKYAPIMTIDGKTML